MARDDAPMGELHLYATYQGLSGHARNYEALNHDLVMREILLDSVACTQAEATKIAERYRKANKDLLLFVRAQWIGEVSL